MYEFPINRIAKVLNCTIKGNVNTSFSEISIDSRTISNKENSLFIAINGTMHNGHYYIKELYESGVRCFMVDSSFDISNKYSEAGFLIVDNCIEGLQDLASYKRSLFKGDVISITGSNGKTIVKEWIAQMIGDSTKLVRSPRSYNSQVGVPLSVWHLNNDIELGIIEAGISKPNEMDKLEKIIKPKIGIFTTLGNAHQEGFYSIEEKLLEKIKLFKNSETIIYCNDEKTVDELISVTYPNKELITWGHNSTSRVQIINETIKNNNWHCTLTYNTKKYNFKLKYINKVAKHNAMSCISTLLVLNYDEEFIYNALQKLTPVAMRMELKQGENNCVIINDAYNSDILSLSLSLDFLIQHSTNQKLTRSIILSDIYESGISDKETYKKINKLLVEKGVEKLYAVGHKMKQNSKEFSIDTLFFDNTEVLISYIKQHNISNKALLIKGARSFKLEKVVSLLEKRKHKTTLSINLNAIEYNLNAHRTKLKTSTKTLAMVKAFAYGSGYIQVAQFLQHLKIDYLGVAFVDEGIALRKAGINLPIAIMNADTDAYNKVIEHNLEPVIYNFETFKSLIKVLKENAVTKQNIHIKIDTGMHRLGFCKSEIPELIKYIKQYNNINISSVFTHLAGTDDVELDEFTHKQVLELKQIVEVMKDKLNCSFLVHALNSAGIIAFPNYQFDMVRIGIGLYGFNPRIKDLQNVFNFSSYISQIKEIKKGDSVGYNRAAIMTRDSRIAIIPVGYADGLSRALSNGVGQMFINGKYAPIVGKICMDMCMIDITDIDASVGDKIEVFGNNISVEDIANKLNTIPYEILTSISQRVERIYYFE